MHVYSVAADSSAQFKSQLVRHGTA